jgi:hypothetical protein
MNGQKESCNDVFSFLNKSKVCVQEAAFSADFKKLVGVIIFFKNHPIQSTINASDLIIINIICIKIYIYISP